MRGLLTAVMMTALFSGCAMLKPSGVDSGEGEVVKMTGTERYQEARYTRTSDVAAEAEQILTAPKYDKGLIDRSDLKPYQKVSIHLGVADLVVQGGVRAKGAKYGRLRIQRLQGDINCQVLVEENESELKITSTSRKVALRASQTLENITTTSAVTKGPSNMPGSSSCRFAVELTAPVAVPLNVDLVRGAVFVENWESSLAVRLDWGDVDVGMIGDLKVSCGRCTLTGENLAGDVQYRVDSGNVGIAGLSGSVDGQTLGDTVLKWRKVAAKSQVKVQSRGGDVVLFFPPGVPVAMDVKAPHAEFDSKLSASSGVPVSVVAELGNVRLYRTPAAGAGAPGGPGAR